LPGRASRLNNGQGALNRAGKRNKVHNTWNLRRERASA